MSTKAASRVVPSGLSTWIIARGLWIDSIGTARVIDSAVGQAARVRGQGWSPFDTASADIWAPQDDGVAGEARVLFSCPVGEVPGTLASDVGRAGPPFAEARPR
jgi:hypothetical protein